jgi:DNA-binding IclR family transcriptional regulator
MSTLPPRSTRPSTSGIPAEGSEGRPSRGIQSVEVGGQLLKALVRSGTALPLKDLARAAGMTPAKAHPYLVSFGKLGLIEQDRVSGHYGLGPLALQLGLIGLQQVDPVRLAVSELPALAQAVGCTVSAAVWGPMGPIIVHVEHGPTPVHVAMRHGTPASLRHTGTGKVFAAFAPAEAVAAALAREGEAAALDDAAFQAELAAIRRERVSRVRDELLPGISAMAVPVFDGLGRLALVMAAIGPSAWLDLAPGSTQAQALQAAGERLSARLGAVSPESSSQ